MREALVERLAVEAAARCHLSSLRGNYAEIIGAAIRAFADEAQRAIRAQRSGKSMLNPGLERAAATIESLK